jgi:hypothetical protein
MAGPEDFFRRIKKMTEKERNHFQMVVEKLILCYGEDPAQAVVIFSHTDSEHAEAMTLNCGDMEALSLINSIHNYLHFINTIDAPPKEKFN